MKFSVKDFFSKCDQIRRKLQIWSHLLMKSLMENFIFCEVNFISVMMKKIWSYIYWDLNHGQNLIYFILS